MIHQRKPGVRFVLETLFLVFGALHVSFAGNSVSKNPNEKVAKQKIQMLQSYAPAQDTQQNIIEQTNGACAIGIPDSKSNKCLVHPLVVTYMEEPDEPGAVSNVYEIKAAVSLDEGASWKRINLSKSRSISYTGRKCFTAHGGEDGDHSHRRLHDDGEEPTEFDFDSSAFKPMLVVKGSRMLTAWTSKDCKGGVDGPITIEENALPLPADQDDKFLVKGHQNCHDYTGEVDGMGLTPFSCVWAARGTVDKNGEILWRKPERITSGRRDAFQLVASTANLKGWALAWQEDPKGLLPGEAAGPGDGMSGSTVNRKTDIWYSFLRWNDFDDFRDDGSEKPPVMNRFSAPVRITDNNACKVVDETNTFQGAPYCEEVCGPDRTEPDEKGLSSCLTKDGIILDGNTGSSRVNMFILYDGMVALAYEESKGLGLGPDGKEEDKEDWGKNVKYHYFKFDAPDEVSPGTTLNLPEVDSSGKPLLSSNGIDPLTNNARRVRLLMQPKSKWENTMEQTAMVAIWREGPEGHGKPAHIMMRRFIGGYAPEDLECQQYRKTGNGVNMCTKGAVDVNAEQNPLVGYEDDARAHRGFLRGDFLVLGYTWTEDWGRGQPHRYDFFVRRSFDGGFSFTDSQNRKERPRNLSNIREKKGWSVMEPRLFATPGTIGGDRVKNATDVQNPLVYFVAYCTTRNPHQGRFLQDGGMPTGKDIPQDIYWTMTDNQGESYMKVFNENAGKWEHPFLQKSTGPDATAEFAAPQIRVSPAGDKFFASYEGNAPGAADGSGPCNGNGKGSDVCFNSTLPLNPLARYDFNGDGILDKADRQMLSQRGRSDLSKYDLNEDGEITGADFWLFDAAAEVQQEQQRLVGLTRYFRGRK